MVEIQSVVALFDNKCSIYWLLCCEAINIGGQSRRNDAVTRR